MSKYLEYLCKPPLYLEPTLNEEFYARRLEEIKSAFSVMYDHHFARNFRTLLFSFEPRSLWDNFQSTVEASDLTLNKKELLAEISLLRKNTFRKNSSNPNFKHLEFQIKAVEAIASSYSLFNSEFSSAILYARLLYNELSSRDSFTARWTEIHSLINNADEYQMYSKEELVGLYSEVLTMSTESFAKPEVRKYLSSSDAERISVRIGELESTVNKLDTLLITGALA